MRIIRVNKSMILVVIDVYKIRWYAMDIECNSIYFYCDQWKYQPNIMSVIGYIGTIDTSIVDLASCVCLSVSHKHKRGQLTHR